MKPLDKECTEQKCWCHKDMGNRSKEDFIEAVHTQDNACEWLEIIAELFIDKAEPIAGWGGDCKYGGALNMLWQKVCEKRGLTPVDFMAATVEERTPSPDTSRAHSKRRRISYRTRLRIYERDGYSCVACGSSEELTLDHILALAKGGDNEDENLQTMCRTCNLKKGVKLWASNGQQTI